ncbi:MAG: triacylglycerol lipase, partial [Oscillospiraceae bacterium]|nr:triacylglycerol lipase [Oscillospiraceae bacterium]
MLLFVFLWLAMGAAIVLDFFDKLPLENAVGRFIGMTILPHIAMFAWYGGEAVYKRDQWGGLGFIIGIIAPICLFALYFMVRLAVKPYRVKFDKTTVNARVRAMYGGKILLKFTAISLLCNTVYYILAVKNNFWEIDKPLWITDTVISSVIILGYGWNGILRITLLCRRLGIVKRVVYFFLLPVPIAGIFVLISMYRTAKAEYDYETTRKACESQRIESQVCKTKYPILLVHGLGFRDWRYFNYWGRIPRELIRNGATIFYGHQEACATVVTNAEHIRKKVLEIIEETGCEKVNIIAHSKGGLDSRYAIAKCGIEDYVATLTTVGTPHHGSQVTDLANKLPDGLYRKVADFMDKRYRKFGDENPDFYTACHQFNSGYAEEF